MKKIILGICSVAAAGALFTGIISSSATVAEKNSVGSSKALEIALTDAGVKKENAFKISSEFDKENGRYIFDVDFSSNGKEYDYTVDAKSGEILSRDIETESDSNVQAAPKPEAETTTVPTAEPSAETTVKSDESASSSEQTSAPSSQPQRITLDEAKKVALGDAGVSSSNAKFTKSKLDRDDGRYEYEIEFIADNKEYEYTVDAYTGKVLEKDIEAVKTVSTVTTSAPSSQSQRITLDEAKKVALGDAGVSSSNAKFTKSKLDRDNGRYEYEIEFIADNKEYEYTVDAYTGKILDKETASRVNQSTDSQTSALISIDKARSIALDHAGLKASEVVFEKVKLEKEHGRYEYEVEFSKGNIEYEYTVNAKTGTVIDFDKEYDD